MPVRSFTHTWRLEPNGVHRGAAASLRNPRPDLNDRMPETCSLALAVGTVNLQALVDECGSESTVPRFLFGCGARHAPHFAPGVNCTDRHEDRQAPVGYHMCETESRSVFVNSAGWRSLGWGIRCTDGYWTRSRGWLWQQTPRGGEEFVGCFCGLQDSSEEACIQATQSRPCAPFPSHSIRHAHPFASKGLRDFGLPATSGNYPRRDREWSCFCWELIHRPRLERARWAGGHLKTSSASLWGAVMASTAISHPYCSYPVNIASPPTCPGHRQAEDGNLARVSRPIGEDRVSWLQLRLPNVASHATSGWEPCKVAERTQFIAFILRACSAYPPQR